MNANKAVFEGKSLILILLACSIVNATTYLAISPEDEGGYNNLCWAASADMLLQYYGNSYNFPIIVTRGTGGLDQTNGICCPANSFDAYDVHDLIASGNTNNVSSSSCNDLNNCSGPYEQGSVANTDLLSDIDNQQPVVAGITDDINGHMVLIVGCDSYYNVVYNDPDDGVQHAKPYSLFY